MMTETGLRDDFPSKVKRESAKRRSSLGMTGDASVALVALAGCGDYDDVGGGAAASADNSACAGGSGNETGNPAIRGAALIKVDAGAGDDVITTGTGARAITVGLGDDTLTSGAGNDMAVHAGDLDGLSVKEIRGANDAATTFQVVDTETTGDDGVNGGTDTLVGIEIPRFVGSDGDDAATASTVTYVRGHASAETNIRGHAAADTYMVGNDGSNTTGGGGGSDVVSGGVGDDTINGFLIMPAMGATEDTDDMDTSAYAGNHGFTVAPVVAEGTWTVVTVTDTATMGDDGVDGGADTIAGIGIPRFCGYDCDGVAISSTVTNIRGHVAAETNLVGNDGNNTFEGGGGGEVVTGGVGDDTINGFLIMSGMGATEAAADTDTAFDTDTSAYAGGGDGFTVTAAPATTDGAWRVVTVTETAPAGEGEVNEVADTLTSIEQLRFNSGGMTAERVNVGLVFRNNTESRRLDHRGTETCPTHRPPSRDVWHDRLNGATGVRMLDDAVRTTGTKASGRARDRDEPKQERDPTKRDWTCDREHGESGFRLVDFTLAVYAAGVEEEAMKEGERERGETTNDSARIAERPRAVGSASQAEAKEGTSSGCERDQIAGVADDQGVAEADLSASVDQCLNSTLETKPEWARFGKKAH